MQRSSSKSSFGKKSFNQKYVTDHNKLLLTKIETTFQQASTTLPYVEFCQYFSNIVKSIIQKYESESTDSANINSLKRLIAKYNPNTQLEVRLMLLQVKSQLHIFPQQSLSMLTKSKHMIIDTEYEYLLSKVFILEAKIYHHLHRKDLQAKFLLKSIQFAQNFVLEYLNDKEDNRKQITQNIVIAYFELYKLKRQDNHKEAEQFIKKACRTTQKNYGKQSQVAQLLNLVYKDHKNVGKGLQKFNFSIKSPQKAITEIMKNEIKKDVIIYGFYSWEDEKILVQLIKNKHDDRIILSEAEYIIKLNMDKINDLRNTQWIKISQGQVQILQEQVLKAIEIKQQKTMTTKIGIKTISRQDIIKRDNLSSSSEDPSFIEKEDFNFIRKLGRAQSAKRQNN